MKRIFPGDLKVDMANETLETIMERVVKFCVDHEIVERAPSIGYGSKEKAPKAALRFDPTYIRKAAEKKP